MPEITTTYNLLISCPSDVDQYVDIINDCIEIFNRIYGDINNIVIKTKHWSTDSYPESGDKPQNLLNKQLVEKCDAAVAIFWTKFGTPTDKYGSGTEEEIEEMLASEKQVFMYFLDAPIEPSKVDHEQYKKVQVFKEKYKDRGIYGVIKDKEDLKRQFSNHLALHFLKLAAGEKNLVEKKTIPILKILSRTQKEYAIIHYYNLTQLEFLKEKKISIISKIESLNHGYLAPRQKTIPENKILKSTLAYNTHKIIENYSLYGNTTYNNLFSDKDIDICDSWKNTIYKFTKENNIEIDMAFWNVGNLKIRECSVNFLEDDNTTLIGQEKEQKRYNLIKDLYWAIVDYYEYISFFEKVEKQGIISLTLANVGNTFDEDIDVKISIKKDHICKRDDIPIPESNLIKEIIKMHFLEYYYQIKADDVITEYSGYPPSIIPKIQYIYGPFNNPSAQERYNQNLKEYKEIIEHIFCYEYYTRDDMDILKFHIDELKHNTIMAFPSVLVFKEVPDSIDYEIRSKHVAELVKGTIKISK